MALFTAIDLSLSCWPLPDSMSADSSDDINIHIHEGATQLPPYIAAQLYDLDKDTGQDVTQSRDSYSGISASTPAGLAVIYRGDWSTRECAVLGKVEFREDLERKWTYIDWLVAVRGEGYSVLRKFEQYLIYSPELQMLVK